MHRRNVKLTHPKQRSLLTDMLPFEVPPTFSNLGFYRFVRDNCIEIQGKCLQWVCESDRLDPLICLLFDVNDPTHIKSVNVSEWGKTFTRRSIALNHCNMSSVPFAFRIAHKLDGRVLSVVHPRNQIQMACFYAEHSPLIIYYATRSAFSLRHPVATAKYVFYRDKLHELNLDEHPFGVEEAEKEYEQMGSYYVYRKYRNIHKFFESYQYHQCETKYDTMVQVDVSKCFDSIYTHSISWAILGKEQTKFNIKPSEQTFSGRFDRVMQALNHHETNGIVIGPEFARVFAEIILQSIDESLLRTLNDTYALQHKKHYDIYRYVDDYFVFCSNKEDQTRIIETLQASLRAMKLSINAGKIRYYERPLITEITIAKDRISSLLSDAISSRVDEGLEAETQIMCRTLSCTINSNRLIVRYKAAVKESNVEYGDLINYTFAITENKITDLLKHFISSDKAANDCRTLVKALRQIFDFAFFVYSASPMVNHTIRLCRMLSYAIHSLNKNHISYDLKHYLYKYLHDSIVRQISKNAIVVHKEIETLYLLISLSQIGKEYWLPEPILAKYFGITPSEDDTYVRKGFLNHFSITVLLTYIKHNKRYEKLRIFIEQHALSKLQDYGQHCHNNTESVLLFLDLLVCPYISDETKRLLGKAFGLDYTHTLSIKSANNCWFTLWGNQFNVLKQLDAKRSREVY